MNRSPVFSLFDLVGLIWVILFTYFLLEHLKKDAIFGEEVTIAISKPDLDRGFREGVEWHGIYLREAKVGFSRLERRKIPSGYVLKNLMRLNMTVMRQNQTLTVNVTTTLNEDYTLRDFDMKMDNPHAPFAASGKVNGRQVEVHMRMGTYEEDKIIELERPPIVELGVRPLLMRKDLKKNERYVMKYFDPLSLKEKEMVLVYLGKGRLHSLGEETEAHQLRRFIGKQAFDAWVNDLGEVLDERLPLGYVSIRESEAEATYGVMRYEGTTHQDIVEQSAVYPKEQKGDKEGAYRARWHFSGFSTDTFQIDKGRQILTAKENYNELVINKNHPLSEITGAERAKYLSEEAMLPLKHPKIINAVNEAIQNRKADQTKADSIVNWVYNKLEKKPVISIPHAVQILETKEGDCNEHATLTVALLRAANVPARIASGLAFLEGRFLYHAWVEYHNDERWVSADPTWGQGNADVGHVRFLIGGLEQQLALVQIVGNLRLNFLQWESKE